MYLITCVQSFISLLASSLFHIRVPHSLSSTILPISLFSILGLFVSGCTSLSDSVVPETIPQQFTGEIPGNWTINGRISVINGDENWYAKFVWIQKDQDFQLSFTGPLGETELQISQIAQHVHLKTPSGEHYGTDLEQLLLQETGMEFPISSLRFWLQGLPASEINSRLEYADDQTISEIFQDGWHIQYPKKMWVVQPSKSEILLPKKIIAKKQGIKIKLIITRWLLGESSFQLE